jgi:isoquinoline 1-oxidoreductase alpha subunit
MAVNFTLNGNATSVDVDPETPLLWVIREELALTGTKFGCGMALCGACTVQLDGTPIRSCVTALADVEGTSITTIEGVDGEGA